MFGRKQTAPAEPQAAAETAEPTGPKPGDVYSGPVCFRDGFYYPLTYTPEGAEIGPDNEHPLIHVLDQAPDVAHFEYAAPDSPSHFHTYGNNPAELVVN